MSPIVFQLRFVGGPNDGMCVYTTRVPDTRMVFPFGELRNDGPVVAYSRVADVKGAVYECERTGLVCPSAHGMPVLHYYFRAVTTPACCPGFDEAWWSRAWSRAGRLARRIVLRCRNWLVAPVNHPLRQPYVDDSRQLKIHA